MSTPVSGRVMLDRRAVDYAFHIGQWVERSLIDCGIELARQSGSSIVTEEHIESCLDQRVLHRELERIREVVHGEVAGGTGTSKRGSREAA